MNNPLLNKHNRIAGQIFCVNAISYIPVVIFVIITFFIDYYVKGSAIQGYNLPAEHFTWFYNIFGNNPDNYDQLPVLRLDIIFCIFSLIIVCYDIGFILYTMIKNKNEKTENKKESIREYIKSEKNRYKKDLHPIEYISWWILRVAMVWAVIHRIRGGAVPQDYMIIVVNLVMTFIVSIFRFLTIKMPDIYKLPPRVQTFLNIFVFGGSFLGHGFELNSKVQDFDKILHFISGCIVVWIGALIFSHLFHENKTKKWEKYLVSVGLSMQVMIVWECFEFIADFIIDASFCQNWYFNRMDSEPFINLFGTGAMNAGQDAVIDTNLDIIYALIGCAIGTSCLSIADIVSAIKNRNKERKKSCLMQNV